MSNLSGPMVPRADAAFRSWASAFANTVSADPPRFMMTVAEAASVMQAVTIFNAAFKVSSSPATRTRSTIADKQDARSIAEDRLRAYAGFIRINRGISDGDKAILNIKPRRGKLRRRWVPTANPGLGIIGMGPGWHTLKYSNLQAANPSGKPFGAARLELWMAVTEIGQKPSLAIARSVGSFTRSRFSVEHKPEDNGRTATYWGRWVGSRNDVGPWSLPVSLTIAFGAGAGTECKPAAKPAIDERGEDGEQAIPRKLAA